ncbi:hypothetical protein DB347_19815 [Opitutaceae bacterium EW11]|nr:hypothetical protein DB347_19815 [Opitutaceae bacterium EW11]
MRLDASKTHKEPRQGVRSVEPFRAWMRLALSILAAAAALPSVASASEPKDGGPEPTFRSASLIESADRLTIEPSRSWNRPDIPALPTSVAIKAPPVLRDHWAMPIVRPRTGVDYKLLISDADPSVDPGILHQPREYRPPSLRKP